MHALLLSGKEVAQKRREKLAQEVAQLKEKGIVPGLATILVGENPASAIYVKNKIQACEEAGIRSFHIKLPEETSEKELLQKLDWCHAHAQIHAILIQLPFPPQIEEPRILESLDPRKDADGFHPLNLGKLFQKKHIDFSNPSLPLPCTPAGCMALLETTGVSLSGKRAVVLGRSTIVGKPMALLLTAADVTVTLCHSRTADLPQLTQEADILVAAMGKPEFVKKEMVKEGAIVLDVGINRTEKGLTGDVAQEVAEVASWLTPVPGGVGPMTVQMLLENTVRLCKRQSSSES